MGGSARTDRARLLVPRFAFCRQGAALTGISTSNPRRDMSFAGGLLAIALPGIVAGCFSPQLHPGLGFQRPGAEAKPLWKIEIIERGGMLSRSTARSRPLEACDGRVPAIYSTCATPGPRPPPPADRNSAERAPRRSCGCGRLWRTTMVAPLDKKAVGGRPDRGRGRRGDLY